jgi:hypothetical protein
MRVREKWTIGATLILAVIAVDATVAAIQYAATHERAVDWTWDLRAPNGNSGFAMILNSNAWEWVSGKPGSEWAETLLTDRTDHRLTALIEHGIQGKPTGCPAHWLLAQVKALPNGSVFVSGYCATEAELEKARGNAFAEL